MEQMESKISRIENKITDVLLVITCTPQQFELHGRGSQSFLVGVGGEQWIPWDHWTLIHWIQIWVSLSGEEPCRVQEFLGSQLLYIWQGT